MDIAALFDGIVSHAKASGLFTAVNGHEPKASPGQGLTAAVWLQALQPVPRYSGLAASSARVEFNLRIYTPMLSEPQDAIDPRVFTAMDTLITAYSGDFTLGGDVMHVDLLGATGTGLTATAGYLQVDSSMMRVMTLTIPLIIADAYPQAA